VKTSEEASVVCLFFGLICLFSLAKQNPKD